MQTPEVIKAIDKYKEDIMSGNLITDYDRGSYNGLEIALALIEGRPAFLLSSDNKLRSSDIEKYPEYFL